jgi:peptide chain release factor 1
MLDKLKVVENRYLELGDMTTRPDFYNDPKQAARLLKEQRDLEPVVTAYRRYLRQKQTIADLLEMLAEPQEPELRELCQLELNEAKDQLPQLEQELKLLLLPKDPNDGKNVILEIRAGVGGEESALFAHSLYRMYSMYAEKRGWKIEITTLNETELGGVKELTCLVSGADVYSRLKFESGVHRVQRVPETESGGRVHTSTATVVVMPEVDEVEVNLNPADIKMEVFRSSGAGGQHINKTSSAVRLIHLPTGTVVECQQERSQVQNREKAMRILYSRLYQAQQEAQAAEVSAEKRSQVGMGMRNEKIRTYNFPQSRVTDHRIGLTLYKISEIMDGDLDEIIDGLITADQAEKLSRERDEDEN